MKKKIKHCSLAQFCSNDDIDNYPLLAIMRNYLYHTKYAYVLKNTQWQGIQRFFSKDFLNKEIEVKENIEQDIQLQKMLEEQDKRMPKELRDLLFGKEININEEEN